MPHTSGTKKYIFWRLKHRPVGLFLASFLPFTSCISIWQNNVCVFLTLFRQAFFELKTITCSTKLSNLFVKFKIEVYRFFMSRYDYFYFLDVFVNVILFYGKHRASFLWNLLVDCIENPMAISTQWYLFPENDIFIRIAQKHACFSPHSKPFQ